MLPQNGGKSSLLTQTEAAHTTLAERRLLQSLKDREYRSVFVKDRLKSSVALQIRALREQRNKMTQKQLGDAIGMAQTWVSKLENPDYGKMTVATLLRLATDAFDTDLEIKFRPFSETISSLPRQGPGYFHVPSFEEELPGLEKAFAISQENATEQTGNPPGGSFERIDEAISLTRKQIDNAGNMLNPELANQITSALEPLTGGLQSLVQIGIGDDLAETWKSIVARMQPISSHADISAQIIPGGTGAAPPGGSTGIHTVERQGALAFNPATPAITTSNAALPGRWSLPKSA